MLRDKTTRKVECLLRDERRGNVLPLRALEHAQQAPKPPMAQHGQRQHPIAAKRLLPAAQPRLFVAGEFFFFAQECRPCAPRR